VYDSTDEHFQSCHFFAGLSTWRSDCFATRQPGLPLLDGRFMTIHQAKGMPKGRAAGLAYLKTFGEDMMAAGFVA
jgi:hypothetical protein